ncbi:MAG TPA: glycosyl hydrolase [Ktedonobacteraceae bacterium]
MSTNIVWPGLIDEVSGAQTKLNTYAPPLVRIHAGTDGGTPALPEATTRGKWDFTALDQLVNNVRAYGGSPLLNVRCAPNWMWTCTAYWSNTNQGVGTLRDLTFQEFAAYMARLVSYYNKGSMTTEAGEVLNNPAGTNNRITYWEIWNEPDLSNETPCHPADWGPALTSDNYVKMWNAVVPQMRAVDPSIKVVGPAITDIDTGQNPEYVPDLMQNATYKPDVISYHGYGGWDNSQGDLEMFDGDGGLSYIVHEADQVHSWAPGKPVWMTEINVNADWGNDPAKRPSSAYGVAWVATAFRNLGLKGVALLNLYDFIDIPQFGLIDDTTGAPNLAYWRDMLLNHSFPTGSTLLKSSSSKADILTLAVRQSNGAISILVINRQVNSHSSVGGRGLPATVTVQLQGITPGAISLQRIDSSIKPSVGPQIVTLSSSTLLQVSFNGYGIAIFHVLGK